MSKCRASQKPQNPPHWPNKVAHSVAALGTVALQQEGPVPI